MNFILADKDAWLEPERPICQRCLNETLAREQERREAAPEMIVCSGMRLEPLEYTDANDMDIGCSHPVMDDLTFFEEELIAPVQPVVRIFTLDSTGQTEMRGHVANWVQAGPQWVRQIPVKAGDAKILLVRQYPKDRTRKQRVPFIASRSRMEAALARVTSAEAEGGHRGFQKNRLVAHGIQYSPENLATYNDHGEEPDPDITVVDQVQDARVGRELFAQ